MSTKKTAVVVAGLYINDKTGKPYDLGDDIKVAPNTAEAGLASGVFLAEGSTIGESAPQDSAKIERLTEENAELKAFKVRVDGILEKAKISLDDLEAELSPDPNKNQKAS